MWHEARKQERRIRGMIVDYRKRAERRQDFYEKIKADPTQFIQVHGRRCKIHLDPAVAAAGDGAAIIVPWQGQADNLIDRFDVRAHLDFIPAVAKSGESDGSELSLDERQCNYERYRILAQNDFLGVTEEKFLHQLYLEEQYGVNAQLEAERNAGKKKQQKSGATIGYSYSDTDPTAGSQPFSHLMHAPSQISTGSVKSEKGSDSESDSDMDMDVAIDITKLDTAQAHELNACGRSFGMISNDFYSYLTKDADEADALRLAREEEQEKMLLSGRRSRRERRAQKERRIASRPFSPPSYAAKEDLEKKDKQDEDSESRSPSPADANAGKITYITSFGGEDELQPHSKISINIAKGTKPRAETSATATYAQKVKENLDKLQQVNEPIKSNIRRHTGDSRSRSRSRRRELRQRSRTRSRERRRRRERHSRSSSYEHSRHHKRSKRSGTRSRDTQRRRYRSLSRSSRSGSRSSRRSRSRKPANAKSKTHARTTPPTNVVNTTITQHEKSTPHGAARSVKAELSQMISYPLPARVLVVSANAPSAAQVSVPILAATQVAEPPPPPFKRYYGRKRGNDSSSNSASDSEDAPKEAKTHADTEIDSDEHMDVDTTSERSNPLPSSSTTTGKQTGKYSTTQAKNPSYSNAPETKGTGGSRLNLRERLKRKMQNLINKQYKADKRAEIEKSERERQQQQEREDEMRELALKLRRRQRELRHKYGTPSSGKASESDTSDTLQSQHYRRSSSEIAERVPVHNSPPRGQREVAPLQRRRGSRSASRSRRRTRSRSRSHGRQQQRRSRSRSRKYRRSASRSRRQRDGSCERSIRSRHGERYRHRSRSRTDRDRDRERERNRERDYAREDRERIRDRDGRQPNVGRSGPDAIGSSRTSKIVISAPPKLKKLVDY